MPIRYEIDTHHLLIRTKCTGDVTFAEVRDHFRELSKDGVLPSRLDVLLDLTEMASVPESPS